MKTKIRTRVFRIIIIIAAAFLTISAVNEITYRPFMWAFKGLMNLSTVQGNVGEWEETISQVDLIGTETVSISGYPNAEVQLYARRDMIEGRPLIIYIHGGGWCSGKASAIEWYAKLLASNGYVVANVDYALAPEYQYPASTIQLAKTVNYMYKCADKYGYDKDCIFIGGNSAGAHLSSQLGAIFTNPEYARKIGIETTVPADSVHGLILYNGVYDFDTVGDCKFPFFDKLAWSYVGKKNYTEFDKIDEISVVRHITANYPPVFITVGDADPLQPQTLELIEKLEENNVKYDSILWTGTNANLWHDYIYEQNTEEAIKAYEMTVRFIELYRH